MGKFCGMCGYKLEEDWTLCPKCGHKVKKVEPLEEVKYAEDTPIQEAESPKADIITEENETESPEAVAKSKKKSIVKIISLVLAILLLLGGGGFFLLRFIRVATAIIPESNYVIKNEYGEFFLTTSGLINLDCPEDGSVEVTCDGDEIGPIIFDYYWVAEEAIYSVVYDKDGFVIYKSQFESETEIEAEVWMDSEELRDESDVFEEAMDYPSVWSLQYSDGYLYFIKRIESVDVRWDLFDGRLYRINIDTREIECIDKDASVSSYIVDNNDIYFTGIYGNESGVFRMNPDGSKRKLIYEVDNEELIRETESLRSPACYVLSLYKNRIYINSLGSDGHKLISISKSGKREKVVVDESFFGFKLDAKRNKAYYGIRDDGNLTVYDISLGNFKSKKLLEIKEAPVDTYAFIDNKLYFSVSNNYDTSDNLKAITYDIRKKEATGIYYDSDDEEYYTDGVDDFIEIEK